MTRFIDSDVNLCLEFKQASVAYGWLVSLISYFNCNRRQASFLLVLLLFNFSGAAEANNCTVTSDSNTAMSRKIELNVFCPDSPFFKLSESPDFQESATTGVTINIDSIDVGSEYADISVTYPNGIPGGNGIPFEVPNIKKELRILAVMFNFGDGELQPPAYATQAWAENMLFGETVGFDGEPTPNSLKKYVEQNSYGKATVVGEVYPQWVNLPSIENYRDINGSPSPRTKIYQDLIDRVVELDPGFFNGKKFDFLVGLTPGGILATTISSYNMMSYPWEGETHGIFDGLMVLDIPVDSSSNLYGTIEDESRVSYSTTMVISKFNPSAVQGVWLATDLAHTGTNYYTGGRVTYDPQLSFDVKYIELGTPLPDANTEVIITYNPSVMERLDDALVANLPPDTLVSNRWFGFFLHELFHGAGVALNGPGLFLADLYQQPWENIREFGLMSAGNQTYLDIGGFRYNIPAHLSGYSKMMAGYLQPYTLNYGENETSIRLYKTEEDSFTDTNNRVKLIKIPLTFEEDSHVLQLINSSGTSRRFFGKEYLLMEWRYKGDMPTNVRNFDAALPSEGLIIYHVIEGAPDLHGRDTDNIVRIIDATPPDFPFSSMSNLVTEEAFSIKLTPAAFGDESGLYSYIAASTWNRKQADSSAADFMLSRLSGNKTIYAKFMDLNGNLAGTSQLNIMLDDSQIPASTLPEATLSQPSDGETISGGYQVVADTSTYYPVTRVDFLVDGTQVDSTTLFPYDFYWQTGSETNGPHILEARVYDEAGNVGSHAITVNVSNQDSELPDVTITNPTEGDQVAGSLYVTASAFDNQAVERVEFYLEGQLMDSDFTNNPYSVSWNTTQYGDGLYMIQAQAYDISGNMNSHSITVRVNNNQTPGNTPPVADAGDDLIVTDSDGNGTESVTLDGSASYDPDGSITNLSWYENNQLIATGAKPILDLNLGDHDLTLVVTDNNGATAVDNVLISIDGGSLNPPSNLSHNAQVTTVSLNWLDNSSNEEGFYIERGTKKKGVINYSRINQTAANANSFSETVSNGTYYYRLQAFNLTIGMESDYSNEIQVKIERSKGKR